jgi:hypothetical protein
LKAASGITKGFPKAFNGHTNEFPKAAANSDKKIGNKLYTQQLFETCSFCH